MIYLSDSYIFQESATVRRFSCVNQDSIPNKACQTATCKIVLDQTVFSPQGGGQPSDTGIICSFDGTVKINVIFACIGASNGLEGGGGRVVEHYGSIVDAESNHEIDPDDPKVTMMFSEGSSVKMQIDEVKRRLYARLHSAGHALDAALLRLDGMSDRLKPTKGYHFTDGPFVEYEGDLTESEMKELPSKLTEIMRDIVSESITTCVVTVPKIEAAALLKLSEDELTNYPDEVRVVYVADHPCACGGTHVKNTSELGTVVVTKIKKKKGQVKVSYEISP
jgi:Ser-tRNA(Ala) deacylase AlaX